MPSEAKDFCDISDVCCIHIEWDESLGALLHKLQTKLALKCQKKRDKRQVMVKFNAVVTVQEEMCNNQWVNPLLDYLTPFQAPLLSLDIVI